MPSFPPKHRGDRGGLDSLPISPRARNLAQAKGIDFCALAGSGPGGRIIERDIAAAIAAQPKPTPVAQAMLDSGDYVLAEAASGAVRKDDLLPARAAGSAAIPLRGARKIIAARMLESMRTTAQLTLNRTADARALQAFRQRLKQSDESLGLRGININDLLLFAIARTLPSFPGFEREF